MVENFAEIMDRERSRLNGERETILGQRQELENKLTAIDRELAAINVYERAKSGQPVVPARASGTRIAMRHRRGSKREDLMAILRQNPEGVGRGDILTMMGLKGDKSGEMSVSNALTALIKQQSIVRNQGKYFVVGA